MNKRAVVFGALAGLALQIGVGSGMGILWVHGNVGGILVLLIVAAIISAFVAGLVAAIMSGRKRIIHGIAAVLVLVLASTINNIFTGSFNLSGLLIGAPIALAAGCLGAGSVILIRHISLSRHDNLQKLRVLDFNRHYRIINTFYVNLVTNSNTVERR